MSKQETVSTNSTLTYRQKSYKGYYCIQLTECKEYGSENWVPDARNKNKIFSTDKIIRGTKV